MISCSTSVWEQFPPEHSGAHLQPAKHGAADELSEPPSRVVAASAGGGTWRDKELGMASGQMDPAVMDFARARLGSDDLAVMHTRLFAVDCPPVGLALADTIERAGPADLVGGDDGPPRWDAPVAVSESSHAPVSFAVFSPGGGHKSPLVFRLGHWENNVHAFQVISRRDDRANAALALRQIMSRGLRNADAYRGSILTVSATARYGVQFAQQQPLKADRGELSLPDSTWSEVDRDVTGFLRIMPLLAEAGLGANRGVLVTGPPGTGKSSLMRIIAGELADQAVCLWIERQAAQEALGFMFDLARRVAPSVVFIEDIDLVAGNRMGGAGSLHDFLVAIDGMMSSSAGVLTVASTNSPEALDEAARRPARFDTVIHLGLPAANVRRQILERYLASCGSLSDERLEAAVAESAGLSGAHLREAVRRAVIFGQGVLDEDTLLVTLRGMKQEPSGAGMYM